MTYPPGSPGYSPTPPTTQFSVPTQQLSKLPEPAAEGSSKLPVYLAAAVSTTTRSPGRRSGIRRSGSPWVTLWAARA